ncbi:MAG: SGNH/GDSL hydrolase family protein [Clostridia bacterium]|nr:SGNH/GDSL hydrolase family protein [Clostridia bacterium]
MTLSLEQIKSITAGAAYVEEKNGMICFSRFTKEQQRVYREASKDFYKKTFGTAGIKLKFVTNSKTLLLKVTVRAGSSRYFFSHDIFVNGKHCHTLSGDLRDKNGTVVESVEAYGSYKLGEGEKTVCIYFPWSVISELCYLELDDGATLTPVAYRRKMISFGDSITHGYDASHPSLSYSAILADAFDADARNKGIGGEVFRPELAAEADDIDPEIITVAYGTNDWSKSTREEFDKNSEAFYVNLSRNYPNAKIFAFSPIWRKQPERITAVGEFTYVAKKIEEIANSLSNVIFVNCYDMVPHDPAMFSPDVLHPNDQGFSHYAKGVIDVIKRNI